MLSRIETNQYIIAYIYIHTHNCHTLQFQLMSIGLYLLLIKEYYYYDYIYQSFRIHGSRYCNPRKWNMSASVT